MCSVRFPVRDIEICLVSPTVPEGMAHFLTGKKKCVQLPFSFGPVLQVKPVIQRCEIDGSSSYEMSPFMALFLINYLLCCNFEYSPIWW